MAPGSRPRQPRGSKTRASRPRAADKGKPRRKPRPRSRPGRGRFSGLRSWLLWSLGLALVVSGLILAWWWEALKEPASQTRTAAQAGPRASQDVSAPRTAPATTLPMPLPYEEAPPAQISARELQAVDEALFAGLRIAGVEPASVHLKVRTTPQGEVAVLAAKLTPEQNLRAVERSVSAQLAATKAQGSWQINHEQALLNVSLQGSPTHILRLLLPGAPPLTRPRPSSPGQKPRVAIVIDDLGYQLEPAQRLLGLGLPLTMAVLPRSPHGRQIAEMAKAKGLQVLLHLPMEAKAHSTSQLGKGALLTGMNAVEIKRITLEDLRSVPGAVGVNNHMGSLFSENPVALSAVLAVLRDQQLFFLDSVTSPRSQARETAARMGLANAQRDIFLDHEPARAAVDLQLARLLKMAQHQGQVIAIGHPHGATLDALEAFAERLRREMEIVPVSELMERPAAGELDRAAAKN